jgi:hypothetical protein
MERGLVSVVSINNEKERYLDIVSRPVSSRVESRRPCTLGTDMVQGVRGTPEDTRMCPRNIPLPFGERVLTVR